MQITLEIPDHHLLPSQQAAHLFKAGALSLGQSAKFAGMPYVLFIEYLSREGIPVVNYPPDELEEELLVAASPKPLTP